MNERAYDFVDTLRDVLDEFPCANAIMFHTSTAWTYLVLIVSTDAAVRALSHDLGLGVPKIRPAGANWWLQAISEPEPGEIRFQVVGPRHRGPRPAR
jgi:hypothetical protein